MSGNEEPATWKALARIGLILGIIASIIAIYPLISGLIANVDNSLSKIHLGQNPPPKPGTLLYHADWSNGLNGWQPYYEVDNKEFPDKKGVWSVNKSNELVNNPDLADVGDIYSPSLNNVIDYALVIKGRIKDYPGQTDNEITIDLPDPVQCNQSIPKHSISFQLDTSAPVELVSNQDPDNCSDLYTESFPGKYSNQNHHLDDKIHTFRIDVKGSRIVISIDGLIYLDAQDGRNPVSNWKIKLRYFCAFVFVTDFQVIAL